MAKYAQKILFFFCRPCGEYHEKTHLHYRSMKTQDEAPERQSRTTMREATARIDCEKAAWRRAQSRVAPRSVFRLQTESAQTSSDATIVASVDPLSAMYFEISWAVVGRSPPGSHRRLSIGARSNRRPFLNSLTSTTRTEHRASLRKWKMSASRPQIFAAGTAQTVEDISLTLDPRSSTIMMRS